MHRGLLAFFLRSTLVLSTFFLLGEEALQAQSFTTIIDVNQYGWLDQHSLDASNNFIGNEACVPTSSVNAFSYLQNSFSSIFGSNLSGSGYSSWITTDQTLISLYGTQPQTTNSSGGTTPQNFLNGIQQYVSSAGFTSDIAFNSMFRAGLFTNVPSFNTDGVPTISFLSNALSINAALLVSIDYLNGGGHELLVNGLSWDDATMTGTLYFVDPLNPSQSYDGTNVLGAVLQTTGSLSYDTNTSEILLSYDQLRGDNLTNNPPNPATNFGTANAYLGGALSLTAVPEPASCTLLGLGVLMLIFTAIRRRQT